VLSASPLGEDQGGPLVLLSLLLSGLRLAPVPVADAFVPIPYDHGADRLARHAADGGRVHHSWSSAKEHVM
jgi:hypothetical protein